MQVSSLIVTGFVGVIHIYVLTVGDTMAKWLVLDAAIYS